MTDRSDILRQSFRYFLEDLKAYLWDEVHLFLHSPFVLFCFDSLFVSLHLVHLSFKVAYFWWTLSFFVYAYRESHPLFPFVETSLADPFKDAEALFPPDSLDSGIDSPFVTPFASPAVGFAAPHRPVLRITSPVRSLSPVPDLSIDLLSFPRHRGSREPLRPFRQTRFAPLREVISQETPHIHSVAETPSGQALHTALLDLSNLGPAQPFTPFISTFPSTSASQNSLHPFSSFPSSSTPQISLSPTHVVSESTVVNLPATSVTIQTPQRSALRLSVVGSAISQTFAKTVATPIKLLFPPKNANQLQITAAVAVFVDQSSLPEDRLLAIRLLSNVAPAEKDPILRRYQELPPQLVTANIRQFSFLLILRNF